jgi:hypothetical protein
MEPHLHDDDLNQVKFNALTWWMFGRSKAAAVFYTACVLVTAISVPLMIMHVAATAPWWLTLIVVVGNLGYVLSHMSQLDAIEALLTRLVRRQQVSLADLSEVDRASRD